MRQPLAALLCGAIIAGGISGPAAAYCSSDAELQALNTRVFQSELMVAALACNQQRQYNAFVRRFEPLLVARGRELRDYFSRYYGRKAERALNGFITRIANDAAQRGLRIEENEYCAQTKRQFEQVLAATPARMDILVAEAHSQDHHGIEGCKAQAVAEAGKE